MSTPVGGELPFAGLPVTGSGPFTMIVGLIGLIAAGVGALTRRIARTT